MASDAYRDHYTPQGYQNASHNVEIEAALLGSILIDPSRMKEIAPLIRPSFFDATHADIVQAILDLHAQCRAINLVSVCDELDRRGQLSPDLSTAIIQLCADALPSVDQLDCVRRIGERAQQREREAAAIIYAQNLSKMGAAAARATFDARIAEIDAYLPTAGASRFWSIDDILEQPDQDWIIDGIATEKSTVAVIADGGSGKTWLAQDWCMTAAAAGIGNIATCGIGRTVKGGHVVYLAGEGQGDIKDRIGGWMATHHVAPATVKPFLHFLPQAVPLLDAGEIDRLIADIKALIPSGEPLRMVVFDTLSKSMAGGDENSNADVSTAIRAADRIKNETGATVIILHHTGKNGDIRGASALRNDCDFCILLDRHQGGDEVQMKCSKQRYGVEFEPINFLLQKMYVDENATKLTRKIVLSDAKPQERPQTLSEAQRIIMGIIQRHGGLGTPWSAILSESKLSKSTVGGKEGHINRLSKAGYITKEPRGNTEHYYLTAMGQQWCVDNLGMHDAKNETPDPEKRFGEVRPNLSRTEPNLGEIGSVRFGVSIDTEPNRTTPNSQEEQNYEFSAHAASRSGESAHVEPEDVSQAELQRIRLGYISKGFTNDAAIRQALQDMGRAHG